MDIQLPYKFKLRPYQQAFWDATVVQGMKRAITVWPRRNGKDLTAINVLCAKAIQRTGLYLYIAPYHNQVRQIIWQGADGSGTKFLDYIPPELVVRKRESVMEIELINGSVIKLVGSDNIDSIVGTNPIGLIYTEFSLQKEEAWEYMRPILSENGGFAYFNGTPRGLNHYYAMHRMAEKNPDWFHQYITREDTGIPTPEAIDEERKAGMPESLIEQEYFCSWTSSSESVYVPLDIVQPAADNTLTPEQYQHAPRVMGVDVAYAAKGDSATICRRQGRYVHPIDSYRGVDNMAFASQIAKRIREFKPVAVFIDAGRGEGVISRLWQMGHEDIVMPVHFGGKTYDELYANKKAEMWGAMREWFMDKNTPSIPNDEKLIKEISTPFFDLNEKNKIAIESKKQMKTRGEKSPDRADCLILTFAETIELEGYPSPRQQAMGVTPEMMRQLQDADDKEPYDPLSFCDGIMGDDYDPFN